MFSAQRNHNLKISPKENIYLMCQAHEIFLSLKFKIGPFLKHLSFKEQTYSMSLIIRTLFHVIK